MPVDAGNLSYSLNGVTENKNGLLVALCVMAATGTAERDAATRTVFEMRGQQRIAVGGDKGYDSCDFVADMRLFNTTPHVAQRKHSAIEGRTTSSPDYAVSQRKRKLIEEVGWMKSRPTGCGSRDLSGRRRYRCRACWSAPHTTCFASRSPAPSAAPP